MPKYSQKDLLDAVNAVRNGMSYRKASAKYNVPVMTIQNRVSGQVDDHSHAGRPTVIPPEIEREIVDQIKRAGNMFRQVKGQFHGATQNECLRTAFANGLMCCGAAYMGGYLYTHSVSAAFNRFGMAGFTIGMLATGITCSIGKFKEQKDS